MKKTIALLLMLVMILSMTACGNSAAGANPANESEAGSVYYLNFKPEAEGAWQELAKVYTEQTGIEVKVVTAAGGNYADTLNAEMAKDTAPTLFNCGNAQSLKDWADYTLDLTGTAFANELSTNDFNLYDESGALKAVGYCYESFGIIVNVDLLPPSNTRSYFGGSTWEPVPGYQDLYYFHAFAKEQPDLNWENPKVLQELYTMINWWLEKGLAGFRIDAIINIQKVLDFPSYEADGPDGMASIVKMVESAEGIGEKLQNLKKNTFAKYDAFTVAEVFNMKKDELEEFIGENGHFSTMFDFSANCLSDGPGGWYRNKPISFEDYRRTIYQSQKECMDVGFLSNILENHDEPRGSSRFLPEHAQTEKGMKMLGTVSVLLRGLPFIYQGQEIGMTNCPMESVEEYDDINTKAEYTLARSAGLSDKEALATCYRFSRDNSRTPMQWDASANAGFTTGIPWLKINPNYRKINVTNQAQDNNSILNYYKKLISLRKSPEYRELFTYGDFQPMLEEIPELMVYRRSLETQEAVILANFSAEEMSLILPDLMDHRIALSNDPVCWKSGTLTLSPAQVVVLVN